LTECLELSVVTLDCERCAAEVRDILCGMNGVDVVTVDVAQSAVKVVFDAAQATVAMMISALGEAGYPALPHMDA
jgi:copper chaperone CopZ